MVLPSIGGTAPWLLAYAAVLWVPGLLLGLAAGQRGWTLAAAAPVLTYGVVGLLGPWTTAVGLRWSPLLFAAVVALVGGVVLLVRRLMRVGPVPRVGSDWRDAAHGAVLACVLVAAGLGAVTVAVGMHGLGAIPQDWDAAFHANAVRYIAETGDAGVNGTTHLNWAELPGGLFYPNAYHLLGAVVLRLGAPGVPTVLDTQTALLPGMLALGMAALVRRCSGRAVLAGVSALLVVAMSPFYDMLWRGPLLNYATGVALAPVVVVIVLDLLEPGVVRERVLPAIVFVLAVAGLLTLNPASLFTAGVVAVPAVIDRWLRRPHPVRRDLRVLTGVGVLAIAVCVLPLVGSVQSAVAGSADWPAHLTPLAAVGEFLGFSHATPSEVPFFSATPQWTLVVPLVLGLLTAWRLGRLRWILGSGVFLLALFAAAACSDAPWAQWITRTWWNDEYRLVGAAVIPLAIVAGHGVVEVAQQGVRLVSALARRVPIGRARVAGPAPLVLRAAVPAVLLLALGAASGGFYLARNEERMGRNTGDGPAVSAAEVAGYAELGRLVTPGQRVLNDRGDGSEWMYALDGVVPVAAHYDANRIGPAATLLAARFHDYDADPTVRAAAARLDVQWVAVGDGFLRPGAGRQPGLTDLDRVRALQLVWADSGFRIYRLVPPAG